MTKKIDAVGFTLEKKQSEMIENKLKRISYADDLIIDLIMKVKHDKAYSFDTTVNFKWGLVAHVSSDDYDFGAALNPSLAQFLCSVTSKTTVCNSFLVLLVHHFNFSSSFVKYDFIITFYNYLQLY